MKPRKVLVLAAVLAAVAAFHFLDLGRYATLESLKANRERLQGLHAAHAGLLAGAFVAIYIAQTAFSLPGAAILSLAAGAVFGLFQGTLYVVTAATIGAVLAFLISRTLLRDWVVRRFGARIGAIDRGLRGSGLPYLLFLRLVPVFPFFLVNLAAGITAMPLRTYALGTFVGILPGSLVYVNAGAGLATIENVAQVASPRVLGSLALLGLFALSPAIVKAVRRWRE
ncbi:MAG: TVP38/TMEM64 family protein [Verrucomicrobiota bacterium]